MSFEHHDTRPRLGATPQPDGSCTLSVWAPWAERVRAALLDGAGATQRTIELDPPDGRGYHDAIVTGVEAGQLYALLIDDDDTMHLPDPASALQPEGVHGPSQVVDHTAFAWTDGAWRGRPVSEYVIYELHVGTFTPEGHFDAVIDRLDLLAKDGITAIELLPVAEFPGARNWGYDGVNLFAAHHAYGGPDALRRLVDAAHQRDIVVILDVVYNHFGPEGNYLAKFGPYLTDRYNTPWGDAVNVDGEHSDEVRRFFIDNALHWLRDFHIDALRLDAVHSIVDTSAQRFLAQLSEAVETLGPQTGWSRFLIAESDLNDAGTISPVTEGGDGCDAQWTDDLHHALHVALTGEQRGYYADYTGVADLAQSLRSAFVYRGQYSENRKRRHGARARSVMNNSRIANDHFVVYAQNHDQVGNRLHGDRLSTIISPERLRLAAAVVLLSPYVPMLFMGEEYGETRPFPYFVSHSDPGLVRAVQRGRADEFKHFGDTGTPLDPQAETTFQSAQLDWDSRNRGSHGELLTLHRELLRARRLLPSLQHPLATATHAEYLDTDNVITLHRSAEVSGDETLVVYNFAETPFAVTPLLATLNDGWTCVLTTSEQRFGGSEANTRIDTSVEQVAAHSAVLLRRVAHSTTGDTHA